MIKKLREMLDGGKISVGELFCENKRKIEENKDLNCFITVCEDENEQVKKAQKMIDEGKQTLLAGIPIGVKDNILTKGVRTTCASRLLSEYIPPYSATAVEKMENAGYVLLGKTNMDEFGMGNTSSASFFGSVKNPIDVSLSPGGSSGGSAAAVAAGLCVGSLGSDTGGSVRLPAAYCGVFGLKPTYGKISRFGLTAFASSLEQIGIFAGETEDLEILLNTISGKDPKDMTSRECKCEQKTKGKIGVLTDFLELSDEKNASSAEEFARFYEKEGFKIEKCEMGDLKKALAAYYILSSAEAASNLSRFDGVKYGTEAEGESFEEKVKNARGGGFGFEVKKRIMLGNYFLSEGYYDKYYIRALEEKEKIRKIVTSLLEEYDFLISPTSPTAVPKVSEKEDTATRFKRDVLTVFANLAGVPVLNVPHEKNSTVGISITGNYFDEERIISFAEIYERERLK